MRHFPTAIIIFLFLASTNSSANESQKGIPLVKTESVEYQNVTIPVRSSGVLENKTQQKLSFKVSGIIDQIYVDEGDVVEKGQLLAILDKSEILAQVEQADSVYKRNIANLKRFKKLYEQKLISSEQLQAAETLVDIAKSDLDIAKFNLKHSEIRAASAGRILRRQAEANELISTNQPVFVVSNTESGWILRLGVSDKNIVRIMLGSKANIKFDAYPDKLFSATVSEIAAAAGGMNRLFEVELELDPTNDMLYSGFIGRAEIEPTSSTNVAMLPIESIVIAEGRKGRVFVVDRDNNAVYKDVQIAFIQSNSVAIDSGLVDGDEVITIGSAYVQPGLAVRK